MSKLINTYWDCPACYIRNDVKAVKPTPFSATFIHAKCSGCGSNGLLKFTKPRGLFGSVGHEFFEGFYLTDAGRAAISKREREKIEGPEITTPQNADKGE